MGILLKGDPMSPAARSPHLRWCRAAESQTSDSGEALREKWQVRGMAAGEKRGPTIFHNTATHLGSFQ
jgi:hypothetical protein